MKIKRCESDTKDYSENKETGTKFLANFGKVVSSAASIPTAAMSMTNYPLSYIMLSLMFLYGLWVSFVAVFEGY